MASQLEDDFNSRVVTGLRKCSAVAYRTKFRLYIALLVKLDLQAPGSLQAMAVFIEYLAQLGLRAETLTNYLTGLGHFFALYDWKVSVLHHRAVKLAVRAISFNAPIKECSALII